jgi:hypothetical protein
VGPCEWASTSKSNKFKIFQFCSNLIQTKTNLLEVKKFEIKYGCEGFCVRNNFPYRNFSIFEKYFELKFRKNMMIQI